MATTQEAEQLPTDSLCATWTHALLHSLLYSGDFSDMTIKCRGREFKTHRAIVCSQSPFFKKALGSNFKEGASGIVDLADDDPEIVQCFLEFLYTGSYIPNEHSPNRLLGAAGVANKEILKRLDCPTGSTGDCNSVDARYFGLGKPSTTQRRQAGLLAPSRSVKRKLYKWPVIKQSVEIYILADKYDVPPLRLLARDRFFKVGKEICVDSIWFTSYMTDIFSDLVKKIYKNTRLGDALRQALHRLISLKKEDDFLKKRMREEMMANAELAVGVVDYLQLV
ncbi:BTB/POZ domain-containing protein 19 [Fusarium piperis]|uniref:BTB/POZ domain-containing protein 19 n=1 Tax=Fusarium piperis TaxID=1435070 RepID=A0A9W8WJB5_9HYPO|nr:BTB/POZ domain-containing protein 19 [Fusarium piperis]